MEREDGLLSRDDGLGPVIEVDQGRESPIAFDGLQQEVLEMSFAENPPAPMAVSMIGVCLPPVERLDRYFGRFSACQQDGPAVAELGDPGA